MKPSQPGKQPAGFSLAAGAAAGGAAEAEVREPHAAAAAVVRARARAAAREAAEAAAVRKAEEAAAERAAAEAMDLALDAAGVGLIGPAKEAGLQLMPGPMAESRAVQCYVHIPLEEQLPASAQPPPEPVPAAPAASGNLFEVKTGGGKAAKTESGPQAGPAVNAPWSSAAAAEAAPRVRAAQVCLADHVCNHICNHICKHICNHICNHICRVRAAQGGLGSSGEPEAQAVRNGASTSAGTSAESLPSLATAAAASPGAEEEGGGVKSMLTARGGKQPRRPSNANHPDPMKRSRVGERYQAEIPAEIQAEIPPVSRGGSGGKARRGGASQQNGPGSSRDDTCVWRPGGSHELLPAAVRSYLKHAADEWDGASLCGASGPVPRKKGGAGPKGSGARGRGRPAAARLDAASQEAALQLLHSHGHAGRPLEDLVALMISASFTYELGELYL